MKLELIFCPFQMFLCEMFKVSMFSWICLFAIFRAFAFISLVAGTSTELMEPALLAPPSGGIDGRRGQSQRNEQGKNFFPVGAALQLSNPQRLLQAFASGAVRGNKRKMSKVTFFLLLLRDGWKLAEDDITWHTRETDQLLVAEIWKRPEAYFRCMFLAASLFERERKFKRIYHHGPAAYYTELILSEDLKQFAKLSEADIKNFKAKKKPKKEALQDAPPQSEAPLVVKLLEEDLDLPPVACKEPRFSEAHVLYDRFTHQSGKLRCFIQCTFHKNCRKYTFVANHADKKEAEAWFFAWNALGEKHKKPDPHKLAVPTADDVRKFLRLQMFA